MKKLSTWVLCALFACTTVLQGTNLQSFTKIKASQTSTYIYYKDQLDDTAKIFYNAFESLYTDGSMKTGTASHNISGMFSQADLKAYAEGDATLAKAFQSARDAFMQDYEEIFYIDFTKLSLRIGVKENTYMLLVGNGSYDNYYAEGFSSAEQVDTVITEITAIKEEIKASVPEAMKNTDANLISAIHDEIVNRFTYTYPSQEDMQVSNIYGALVNGTANCQGYSKTLKWILTDYNIPTVLVNGMGINSLGNKESHMWNYVHLDDAWYAVDATWDDPMSNQGNVLRDTYLLRGSDTMNENHFALGQISYGGMEFTYPQLNAIDYNMTIADDSISEFEDKDGDLKVTVQKLEDKDGFISTGYSVKYKGLSMEELNKQGLYLAGRFAYAGSSTQEETATTAIDDATNPFKNWVDMGSYTNAASGDELYSIAINQSGSIQFCITNIKQDGLSYGNTDLSQTGNNVLITKKLKVPYTTEYVAPPFIRNSNPVLTQTINPDKTVHYRVEYDQKLMKVDENADTFIEIHNSEPHIKATAENLIISYGTYTLPDGTTNDSTIIEFDFTPDLAFQGYKNYYNLELVNLVGEASNKAPNMIPISTTYPVILPCPILVAHGGLPNAFVMAMPVLIVDDDQDAFIADNKVNKGSLNITLMATRPSESEESDLNDALGNKLGIDVNQKLTSTFDLTIGCSAIRGALRPGYHVTVGIPYPDGFHPEDYKDVEFRAYHYKYKDDGSYEIQEIVCQITPLGLMVIADDFSPFTVIAVEKGEIKDEPLASKVVSISNETEAGGTIQVKDGAGGAGIYALAEGDSKTFTVKANDGYTIEKIVVDDKEVTLETNATSYDATFDYATMSANSNVKAYFVAKTIQEKEKEEGVQAVVPVLQPEEGITPTPTPDPEPTPEYKETTLQDKDSGISVKGNVLTDTTLTVKALKSDVKDTLQKYNADAKMLTSFELAFSKENAYKDSLEIHVPLDSSYNGKEVTYVTLDGTKTQTTKVTVSNSEAIITTNTLLPGAILDENVEPTPDPTPEYKQITISDEASGIRVKGNLLSSANLTVKELTSDVKETIQKYNTDAKMLKSFVVSFDKESAYKDSLEIHVPLDSSYNGKEVTYVTLDGTKTQATKVTVNNSEAIITTDTLLPGAILDETITPSPEQPTDPTPVYSQTTIKDATSGITVKGNLLEKVNLKVQAPSDTIEKAFQDYNKDAKLITSYALSFDKENPFKGNLEVHIPMDSSLNGKTLTYLTYKDGITSTPVKVENGEIVLSVSELLPSAIINQEKTDTKDLVKEDTSNKDQSSTGAETGDTSNLTMWLFISCGAVIAMAGILVYKNKKSFTKK